MCQKHIQLLIVFFCYFMWQKDCQAQDSLSFLNEKELLEKVTIERDSIVLGLPNHGYIIDYDVDEYRLSDTTKYIITKKYFFKLIKMSETEIKQLNANRGKVNANDIVDYNHYKNGYNREKYTSNFTNALQMQERRIIFEERFRYDKDNLYIPRYFINSLGEEKIKTVWATASLYLDNYGMPAEINYSSLIKYLQTDKNYYFIKVGEVRSDTTGPLKVRIPSSAASAGFNEYIFQNQIALGDEDKLIKFNKSLIFLVQERFGKNPFQATSLKARVSENAIVLRSLRNVSMILGNPNREIATYFFNIAVNDASYSRSHYLLRERQERNYVSRRTNRNPSSSKKSDIAKKIKEEDLLRMKASEMSVHFYLLKAIGAKGEYFESDYSEDRKYITLILKTLNECFADACKQNGISESQLDGFCICN